MFIFRDAFITFYTSAISFNSSDDGVKSFNDGLSTLSYEQKKTFLELFVFWYCTMVAF